ncbi:Ubiquitin-like domain-containing CTD phosphatase [Rhynchospora pubera]|uniref:protein-serine/threonine phosphatase n=1 Tax=Rhynchospora pubera TaxID=906938 RepID=A0AAV8BX39_9POAL|nr:Ubiquitin-like domain-containing CTD phosphatase [Rhynchospora pubera]
MSGATMEASPSTPTMPNPNPNPSEGVEELTLTVKWSGKEYTVRLCADDSVAELKRRICEVTSVLPKRQKLLYPKLASKLNDDSILISQLGLKPSVKMTMIGTVEDEIIVDQADAPEIVDDFELGQDEVVDIKDKDVNKHKLSRRVAQYKIKLLNPCREGRKLLVLDIDYTLFDHRSPAENPLELMRPCKLDIANMFFNIFSPIRMLMLSFMSWCVDLHEFLTAAYAEYDIMIWSATSMKWVELKMGQLGVLSNPNYKITALLDHLAMITVQSDKHGTFDCKPLGLIWAQFPEYYSPRNTIMFDDLKRNFVMNPQNGLTIRPFRRAHMNRGTDQELVKLTQYLMAIAELSDISLLDHSRWESYSEDGFKRRRHS